MTEEGTPQICDFGHSKIVERSGFTTTFMGTARWVAPEVMDSDIPDSRPKLTKASDVFAFAMAALEVRADVVFTQLLRIPGLFICVKFRTSGWRSSQVLTGKVPLFDYKGNNIAIYLAYKAGKRPTRTAHVLSDELLWAMLEECWNQDPDMRPNMSNVFGRLVAAETQKMRQDPILK
jgi:serine/threonine protein kinase